MATVTGNGDQRRSELSAFLRSRRERITPEQAGLPAGLRRRTPGLRREEVAQLSGVGVTWYTWLEQGRPIRVSTQVLTALSRTLRLDQVERAHLFALADVPDSPAGSGCGQVNPELRQILDALVPLPASVLNERFDLLAWNQAYAVIWPAVVAAEPAQRNILWLNFTMPDCCHPYVNRAEQLPRLVAQFRAAYGRHVGEPAWTGLVSKLLGASPEFARVWAEHDVAGPAGYLKIFRHPAHERMVMLTTSLGVLAVPGTKIIVYTPADATCREAIECLLAGQSAGSRFPCWDGHQRGREGLAP